MYLFPRFNSLKTPGFSFRYKMEQECSKSLKGTINTMSNDVMQLITTLAISYHKEYYIKSLKTIEKRPSINAGFHDGEAFPH